MTLINEFRNEPVRRGGPKPLIQKMLDQMDEKDRQDLKDALADTTIPCRAIANVLNRRGYKISIATIEKYRNANGIG